LVVPLAVAEKMGFETSAHFLKDAAMRGASDAIRGCAHRYSGSLLAWAQGTWACMWT
jgi:hypothetical protein